jgi:hypothetical protein
MDPAEKLFSVGAAAVDGSKGAAAEYGFTGAAAAAAAAAAKNAAGPAAAAAAAAAQVERELPDCRGWTLVLTGHSLGALVHAVACNDDVMACMVAGGFLVQ